MVMSGSNTIGVPGGRQERVELFQIQPPISTGEQGGTDLINAGQAHFYSWGDNYGDDHEVTPTRNYINTEDRDGDTGGKRMIYNSHDLKQFKSFVLITECGCSVQRGASNSGGYGYGVFQLVAEAADSVGSSQTLGKSTAYHQKNNNGSEDTSYGAGIWILDYDKATETITCRFGAYHGEPYTDSYGWSTHVNEFTTGETLDVSGWSHVYVAVQASTSDTSSHGPCLGYARMLPGSYAIRDKDVGYLR